MTTLDNLTEHFTPEEYKSALSKIKNEMPKDFELLAIFLNGAYKKPSDNYASIPRTDLEYLQVEIQERIFPRYAQDRIIIGVVSNLYTYARNNLEGRL